MPSRCAIFVDAGYLIASAATRLTGSSFRKGVNVDYAKLITSLTACVEEWSGLPLLRVYWYDAGRGGQPDADQERIAALPDVKLRLGRVGVEGEQKGVDLRIGLDMVSHSRNAAVDTIYLVSGDDDLTEAVEEAQSQGVRIVVLAVPGATGNAHAVSRHLEQASDGVRVLDGELIDATISRTPASKAAAGIAVVAGASAHTSGTEEEPAKTATSPIHIPRPVPTAPALQVAYSSDGMTKPYIASEYRQDPVEMRPKIIEVVERAYDSWLRQATAEQKRDLLIGKPSIPRDLDRALLVDLSDVVNDYTLSDAVRFELRARFWDAVEAHE